MLNISVCQSSDLHEEDVCHVELPDIVVAAELDALPEDLLHLLVVVSLPVDPSLRHQHWDVAAPAREDRGKVLPGCVLNLETMF